MTHKGLSFGIITIQLQLLQRMSLNGLRLGIITVQLQLLQRMTHKGLSFGIITIQLQLLQRMSIKGLRFGQIIVFLGRTHMTKMNRPFRPNPDHLFHLFLPFFCVREKERCPFGSQSYKRNLVLKSLN